MLESLKRSVVSPHHHNSSQNSNDSSDHEGQIVQGGGYRYYIDPNICCQTWPSVPETIVKTVRADHNSPSSPRIKTGDGITGRSIEPKTVSIVNCCKIRRSNSRRTLDRNYVLPRSQKRPVQPGVAYPEIRIQHISSRKTRRRHAL